MTIAGFTALGTRVFFAGARSPYGAMAQRTVVLRSRCFPVPVSVDDATAAALPNPGVSAWLSLTWRGKLAPNETVLILGYCIIQNIKRIPSCVIRGSRALTTCPKVAEPTVPPTPLN